MFFPLLIITAYRKNVKCLASHVVEAPVLSFFEGTIYLRQEVRHRHELRRSLKLFDAAVIISMNYFVANTSGRSDSRHLVQLDPHL